MRKSPLPKIASSKFEPELVSTLRSVLDAAVNQIDVANRTPATKWRNASYWPHQVASRTLNN
jgi:hypothetical protein